MKRKEYSFMYILEKIRDYLCTIEKKVDAMHWIPTAEATPEGPADGKDKEYIVTIAGAMETTILSYDGIHKIWYDADSGILYKVEAWMPKPEIYRSSKADTEDLCNDYYVRGYEDGQKAERKG